MMNVALIREHFRTLQYLKSFAPNGTLEIRGASFTADEPSIFGTPNPDYIAAEIQWYEEQNMSVDRLAEIYGKRVAIWDSVSNKDMMINSNYGWCIYSNENGNQYDKVLHELQEHPNSRRGVMIYQRPNIHFDAVDAGCNDFICTNAVHYHISHGNLHAVVQMRSNDAVFGYNNDIAWQQHVLDKLAHDLNLNPGLITWQAASLHVYPRHFDLIAPKDAN